jgi:hypothetical protein
MASALRVPESVFSAEFRAQPAFPAILEQVNKSPFLVDLLTQLEARDDHVRLDTDNPRSAYFKPGDGDIHIGSDLLPAVNSLGEAVDPVYRDKFVSMLGHEGGHAVLQDQSRRAQTPDEAKTLGLYGEGLAITTEYIVAKQLGGTMWSGASIQSTLDATASATGKVADIATRRSSDPAAEWRAFDSQANAQGASYYGALHPSTARNTTYNEYYPETWAVLNTREGSSLHENIDWDRVRSADIEIERHADGSFQLVGHAVPMDKGPHAGRRVDFSTYFDTRARVSSDTHQTALPAMAASSDKGGCDPLAQAALARAKALLGPEVLSKLDPANLDQTCAAVVAHCARNGGQGYPVQTYIAKDGETLAFRHEPMSLTELSLSEAIRKSVEQHLADAQAGHQLSIPGETTSREMAR